MPNRILAVENVKREMQKGWPYGASEAYKHIPSLLRRIEELENALTPFAIIADKNAGLINRDEMTNVYFKDCITALEFMDRANSAQPVKEDFGIPAE
jgi:hypothetical protein